MTVSEFEAPQVRRSGGLFWFWFTLAIILFVGGALSVGAYVYAEPDLSIGESIVAGFGGLAALIIGLVATAFGLVVGLVGALFGVATAGGAVAVTLFVLASPVIAIILFVLLMRRRSADCPDPAAH